MINFSHPFLIKKYGSWIRVQVRFYDFLFQQVFSNLCIKHTNEELIHGFRDGGDPYEEAVAKIIKLFPTDKAAWNVFLKKEEEQ